MGKISGKALAAFDLSSFDTSKAKYVDHMFSGCKLLQRVKLGAKAVKLDKLPAFSIIGHEDWLSNADGKWCTSDEIAASRLGVADIHTKGGGGSPSSAGGDPGKPDASGSGGSADPGSSGESVESGKADDPGALEAGISMRCLYNEWSGEHFYTSDDGEYAGLVEMGWTDEDVAWYGV